MPYFLIMMVSLIICWAMMLNLAKLLRDRMMMQNAADNAAISVAVYKARILNMLGLMNYAMASSLYGPEFTGLNGYLSYYKYGLIVSPQGSSFGSGNNPLAALISLGLPLPANPMGGILPSLHPGTEAIDDQGSVTATFDMLESVPGIHKSNRNGDAVICRIISLVEMIKRHQDICIQPFRNPALLSKFGGIIGERQEKLRDGKYTGSDTIVVTRGTRLGLRRNENGIVFHRSKRLEGLGAEATKKLATFALNALDVPVEIKEIFQSEEVGRSHSSWMYADRADFAINQKIVVISRKNAGSGRGYPLFGRWLGISQPDYYTVAAAGLYNTRGPMFPVEQGGRPSDSISPVIREYLKCKDGGWDAHLVPMGGTYEH